MPSPPQHRHHPGRCETDSLVFLAHGYSPRQRGSRLTAEWQAPLVEADKLFAQVPTAEVFGTGGAYNFYSYDCAAAFTVQLEIGGVIYAIPEKCELFASLATSLL